MFELFQCVKFIDPGFQLNLAVITLPQVIL
jgi:hypothetical protein